MQAWSITLIVIACLIVVYFIYVDIVDAIFLKKTILKRCEDHDFALLRYEDVKDEISRTKYQTGYYGKAINGYVYRDRNIEFCKGFIILSHGFFGTHLQYTYEIYLLCKAGYKVLAYDQYGCGISEGKNPKSLGNGVYVLENVIADIKKRGLNGSLPLILYGHSWGAYCSIAALKHNDDIRCCIARSGPNDPILAGMDSLKRYNKALYYSCYPFLYVINRYILGRRESVKATRGLKANHDTRVLALHALDDTMGSYRHSIARLAEKNKYENLTSYVAKHGGHNMFLTLECKNRIKEINAEKKKIDEIEGEDEKKKQTERLASSFDRFSIYECDNDVYRTIMSFIEESLA